MYARSAPPRGPTSETIGTQAYDNIPLFSPFGPRSRGADGADFKSAMCRGHMRPTRQGAPSSWLGEQRGGLQERQRRRQPNEPTFLGP